MALALGTTARTALLGNSSLQTSQQVSMNETLKKLLQKQEEHQKIIHDNEAQLVALAQETACQRETRNDLFNRLDRVEQQLSSQNQNARSLTNKKIILAISGTVALGITAVGVVLLILKFKII